MLKFLVGLYYPNWSIACRIAAAMLLAVIVPTTISAYFNLQQITTITTNGEYHQLELLSNITAQRFDRLLLKRQQLAVDISQQNDVIRFVSDPKSAGSNLPQLSEIVAAHPDLEAVLLLDRTGNCLTATMPQFIGHHYTVPEATIFSRLHSNVRDYPGMFVAQAVNSLSSSHSGSVLLKLKGVEIWSVVNRGFSPKTAGQFFLTDSHGTIISHPQVSLLYQQPVGWSQLLGSESSGHFSYQPSPGRMPQIIGFTTLATRPWVLGVSRSEAEFQAPLLEVIWLNLRGVVAVGSIAALVAVLTGMYISRPIHALTLAAQSLEQEDDERFNLVQQELTKFAAPPDDLGQLVRAFLQMTNELHRRDRQLKTQVQFLRIEVDRTRRDQEVAEIIDSDQFQILQLKIQQMRNHEKRVAETETDYFQQLQQQVLSLKRMGFEKNGL
jgi:HAMP domain